MAGAWRFRRSGRRYSAAAVAAAVESVRRRQEAREIAGELEPEFILLLSYALAFAPLAFPQFVAGIFGIDPFSPEYRRRCTEELARLTDPGVTTTSTRTESRE